MTNASSLTAREGRADAAGLVPAWVDRRAPRVSLRDLAALDPLARVLATTDGTVTDLLEAWANEPVTIRRLAQRRGELSRQVVDLDAGAGVSVLRREVVLCGERTGSPLLYAESLIVLDRIPRVVAEGLLVRRTPIGRLLRESGLETYRELLNLGILTFQALAASFAKRTDDLVVSRTYRIIAGARPLMLINERFPGHLAPTSGEA